MIDPGQADLSVVRQCHLLGLSRSSFYYRPQAVPPLDLPLMHAIDRLYMPVSLLRGASHPAGAAATGLGGQS